MTAAEKALARLLARPKDLSWEELVTALGRLGFTYRPGKGSHGKFVSSSRGGDIHGCKPHSGPVKVWLVNRVVDYLIERGYVEGDNEEGA